jgi:hypothetical protein
MLLFSSAGYNFLSANCHGEGLDAAIFKIHKDSQNKIFWEKELAVGVKINCLLALLT